MESMMVGSYSVIGQGYGFFTDTILPSQIFNIHHVPTAYGMTIPSMAQIKRMDSSETIVKSANTMAELVENRLAYLHFNADVKRNYGLFRYASKAGIELSKSSSLEAEGKITYHSLIHEERLFEVFMANIPLGKDSYTHDFITAVDEMPAKKDGICSPGQKTWTQFFNRWGPFVITKASGGGSIEVLVESGSLSADSTKNEQIKAHLKTAHNIIFSKGSTNVDFGADENKNKELRGALSYSTTNVVGGSIESRDFGIIITREEMKKWRDSLKTHPEMLTTNMFLEPITNFIKVVNPDKYPYASICLQEYLHGN